MKTLLSRIMLYLLPAIMDMILGATMYITSVRIAQSGGSPIEVTSVVTVWALVYMIFAQAAGYFTKEENAGFLLSGATFLIAATLIAFVLLPSLDLVYWIMAIQSIGIAFFFTPFQVFMKSSDGDTPTGITKVVGLYTLSWSIGMAAGPFIAAFIWKWFGWQYVFVIMALICTLMSIGIIYLSIYMKNEKRNKEELNSVSQTTVKKDVNYSVMPDLAWLGWICAGLGCLTISILRSYFPSSATTLGVLKSDQGLILALISACQAVTGLLCAFNKTWMYKPSFLTIFGLFGIAGLILFGIGKDVAMFYTAAAFYGIYSGSFFFYLVFHSIVHPEKSARYVSINESVVGLSSITGSLTAGIIAENFSLPMPYYTAAVLVLVALLIQVTVHSMHREKTLQLAASIR